MNASDKFINDFVPVILLFGICSLGHQIELIENRFRESLAKDKTSFVAKGVENMKRYYRPSNID